MHENIPVTFTVVGMDLLPELTKSQCRVLNFLMARGAWRAKGARLSRSKIAQLTNQSPATVNVACDLLRRQEVIAVDADGRYHVSPRMLLGPEGDPDGKALAAYERAAAEAQGRRDARCKPRRCPTMPAFKVRTVGREFYVIDDDWVTLAPPPALPRPLEVGECYDFAERIYRPHVPGEFDAPPE